MPLSEIVSAGIGLFISVVIILNDFKKSWLADFVIKEIPYNQVS